MLARSASRALSRGLTRRVGQQAARALSTSPLDYSVIEKGDHGAFKEYSVIHTDRSLNLMSDPFQRVMRELNQLLKVTYNCDKVVIIPGYDFLFCSVHCIAFIIYLDTSLHIALFFSSGTFGMESVARQFATDEYVYYIDAK
jgi:hypothetical protein